jgi:virginiamycin A acetyltransferase
MKNVVKSTLYQLGLLSLVRTMLAPFQPVLKRIQACLIRRRWRRSNLHNYTHVLNGFSDIYFPTTKVVVGKQTYGGLYVFSYGTLGEELRIGCYCSIAGGVRFVLGGNHRTDTFSAYPFRHRFGGAEVEALTKGPIIVEDDVWIGTGAMILSGVVLAKGTIVAAGSVVTKSTAPYSIIGGNPARLIRTRFAPDLVTKLMEIDMAAIDEGRIKYLLDLLYQPLDEKVLKAITTELI